MIKTLQYNGNKYPLLQRYGNAAQWIMPFAREVLSDHFKGVDVGCGKLAWCYPGAIPADPAIGSCPYSATNLPDVELDYIFSSHCLEHLCDWVGILNYWRSRLSSGGIVFLYLPDFSQEYWRPWNNRKHINILTPQIIRAYFEESGGWCNTFVTGIDLNNSFCAIAEKV